MIDRPALLSDLQRLLQRLEADLLQRSESAEVPEIGKSLHAEYERAESAQRTAQNYEDWRTDAITQAAAAWVLLCVFVRFLEDNQLVEPPKIAGPGERLDRARDEHELYFRSHPTETDREYLLSVFDQLGKLPGTRDVFGEHNPIRELPNWLSGDAAGELLGFFQKIDANTGALVHDFTDPTWDTRFLGDLYQDLSEAARKKYALLQTPIFVEEFILDRTLNPALDEFGLDAPPVLDRDGKPVTEAGFRMIDPACGSGHFLLGAFPRILDRWQRKEPGTNVRELVQRSLDSIYGVDVNPYAVAIARFRLLLAAMRASNVKRLADAPAFRLNLACGDSLLHAPLRGGQMALDYELTSADAECEHAYQSEDLPALKRMLRGGQFHAVVANPPYIVPPDKTLNDRYRNRFKSCYRQYSLAVPFLERIIRLSVENGFTGQITANSFMKRAFGKKLIEEFLTTVDLTHVIDLAGGGGAHIPGHTTPTVILFGRCRKPTSSTVRTVMGKHGDPETPTDPAKGLYWCAMLRQVDCPDTESEFLSVADVPRESFGKHPWSIGGGGALTVKDTLDSRAEKTLGKYSTSIGFYQDTHADEAFVQPSLFAARRGLKSAFKAQTRGEDVRDWTVDSEEEILFPYDANLSQWSQLPCGASWAWFFSLRTSLWARSTFGGGTYKQAGRPFFDYHQFPKERARTPLSLAFASIATHNHFVIDRGGSVYNRSAPIVKLSPESAEDEYLALLGLLNSSTACFWMKQVFYPKASSTGDISTEKGKPEANRFEFAGTSLEQVPIPFQLKSADAQLVGRIAAQIDGAALRLRAALPEVLLRDFKHGEHSGLREVLERGRRSYSATHERMIALQEELDWEIYRAFGLSAEGASDVILSDEAHGIPAEARPFLWQQETAPDAVPAKWRQIYTSRRISLQNTTELLLIESPVYKRPWWGRQGVYGRLARDFDGRIADALTKWLLTRLESYFDFDGRMNHEGKSTAQLDIAFVSVAQLADIARQDAEFLQVGELYRDDPAFDVQALVGELVTAESVPLLPVLRYKSSGLIKRGTWERTWDLQRQEDAIDARTTLPSADPQYLTEDAARDLKQEQVGNIPVPTKYDSKDFLDSNFWRLRGKLDVPKERWISFPHCEGPDGTPVIAWAGYDHLQLAKAISAYYVRVQTEFGGTDDARLVPLLACLIELLPWLKQWHNEPDPAFDSMRMGDYFEGFITEEARNLPRPDGTRGWTLEEIKSWTPPHRPPRKTHPPPPPPPPLPPPRRKASN